MADDLSEAAALMVSYARGAEPGLPGPIGPVECYPPTAIHPAASLFPELGGAAFGGLVADIRRHGLRMPIVTVGGAILDGRARERACRQLGITPRYAEYTGDDVLGLAISMNLQRRHLSPSQLAMIAAVLATTRQGARTDLAQNCARSQAEAAGLLGCSRRLTQYALTVRRHGPPELVRQVEAGEVSVMVAAKRARMPTAHRHQLSGSETDERPPPPGDARLVGCIVAPIIRRPPDDVVLWAREQAQIVRTVGSSGTAPIDCAGIAGMLDTVAQSHARQMREQVATCLTFLIKFALASLEHGGQHTWREKIGRARCELRRLLTEAPSLQRELPATIEEMTPGAKARALNELQAAKRRPINLAELAYGVDQVTDEWFPAPAEAVEEDLRKVYAAAKKVGLVARKSTARRGNWGGFQLADAVSGLVRAGANYDLAPADALAFCASWQRPANRQSPVTRQESSQSRKFVRNA